MKRKNKRVFSRTLSLMLAATVIVCMMPGKLLIAKAASATFDVTSGNVSIDASSSADAITITGTTATNTISVTGTGTVNITLKNVSIDVSGATSNACAFSIASGTTVNLTVNGTSTLKSGLYYAGLQVPHGATLTISGTSSDNLAANGGGGGGGVIGGGAGIGSAGRGETFGTINISGGIIHANGSNDAFIGAGIGGGYLGDGGITTISGGTVTAIGGESFPAAGIGGGYNSRGGGRTIISGGSVNANSISGKPTSDGSTYVYLAKVPLAFSTPVNSLSITKDSSPLNYGYNGMAADSTNALYLYFPSGSITASVNGSSAYSMCQKSTRPALLLPLSLSPKPTATRLLRKRQPAVKAPEL